MRVELHDDLKQPTNISASRVVVYDHFDNPIAVVVHVDGGHYVAATASNKSFQTILKALGIDKTLVVDHLDTKKLKALK